MDVFFKKRGVIGVQFNWVFVLVTGAIFLILITSVITTQRKGADQEISADLLVSLNAFFGIGQESNVFKEIEIPRNNLEFICKMAGEDVISNYQTSSGVSQQTPVEPIFSPTKLSGTSLYLWSMDWNVPFKTISFSFVTNDRSAYYFYNTTENKFIVKKIMKEIPSNVSSIINYKIINPGEDITGRYDNYKVIYINEEATNTKYPYLEIEMNDFSHGNLTFSDNNDKTYFIGKASLFGAIFSADRDNYVCNMNKAFERYRILSVLMIKRTESLQNEYNRCDSYYGSALSILDNINEITSGNFGELEYDNIKSLYDSIEDLEITNEYLAKGSCPVLY